MNEELLSSSDATILAAVDWPALRTQLQIVRKTAGLSPAQLGRAIGMNKSTVGRIEDVEGRKKHAPTLETIERWARACGLTLSSFFAGIEHGHETGTVRQRVPPGRPQADEDAAVSSAYGSVEEMWEEIGRGLVRVIRSAQSREQAPSAGAPRSARGEGHRKNR